MPSSATESGILNAITMGEAKPKKKKKHSPVSTTENISNAVRWDDYRAMLGKCENDTEHLLLRLLWSTGGRITEVLEVKPDSIKADDEIQMLNEKQWKIEPGEHRPREIKTIYVPLDIIEELRAFIDAHHITRRAFVFPGRKSGEHLSRITAWRRVKAIANRAEVVRDRNTESKGHHTTEVSPHAFRHGCAVEMMEHGSTLGTIQHHLGHKNPTTTGIYATVWDPIRRADTTKMRV